MNKFSESHGVLVVDKPAGMTSHDVVDRTRRLFRTKRVGHTGTLDPDATGVLVLCLGNATRFAEYLSASRKHYVADVTFGIETDTLDASGTTLRKCDASHVTSDAVRSLLSIFRGRILQTPPMVSARHHEGRRLYELAREGITVERQAREVEVHDLELSEFMMGMHPTATLEITCSTGTYIRTLADDLGRAAGTGAMMRSLRRTWVGSDEATAFTLRDAYPLEKLEELAAHTALSEALLPLTSALRNAVTYRLTAEGLRLLRHGQSIPISEIAETHDSLSAELPALSVALDESGKVCAVVRREPDCLRPEKVLLQL